MIQTIINPRVLKVDISGIPQTWLKIDDAIRYYATDMVVFELGSPIATYRGGINRVTNKMSEITANSIIAVKGEKSRPFTNSTPALTNESLFERDQYVCAYCGGLFHDRSLSRDHIIPVSLNGQDTWNNVVTACKDCNSRKGNKTLEQARMKLLYLPYTPDKYEDFILRQGTKKILADQMEYLLNKVSNKSRVKKHILETM